MGATLGILGSGQLGRMIAQAASNLNVDCKFLPFGDTSSCEGLGQIVPGDWKEERVVSEFMRGLTAVTYEWENVPLELIQQLEKVINVFPPAEALVRTQDRLDEKIFFQSLGIPTAHFVLLHGLSDLEVLQQEIGFPSVLKTRRFGYDGKGQAMLRSIADAERALQEFGSTPVIAERFVSFERELSIVAVCAGRETVCYPLVENTHFEGILRLSIAPAQGVSTATQQEAEHIARQVSSELRYRGVLCLELFDTKGGLVVNEMAPRVHNSGHWTLDGARTSQFENHVRAVMGMPLGSTELTHHTAMINIVGEMVAEDIATNSLRLHSYLKADRPGRKVGHLNLIAGSERELHDSLERFRNKHPRLFPQDA